jgi:hypothetical protein
LGTSSMTITSGAPNLWIRTAFIEMIDQITPRRLRRLRSGDDATLSILHNDSCS